MAPTRPIQEGELGTPKIGPDNTCRTARFPGFAKDSPAGVGKLGGRYPVGLRVKCRPR